MFVHMVLSTPSSPERTDKIILGTLTLFAIASIPWWFVLSGMDISGLWVVWGGLVGATIGALAPSWPSYIRDSLTLRRQRYTRGLFGTPQDAKATLDWNRTMTLLTILGFGAVTVPLGSLIGLVACFLVR